MKVSNSVTVKASKNRRLRWWVNGLALSLTSWVVADPVPSLPRNVEDSISIEIGASLDRPSLDGALREERRLGRYLWDEAQRGEGRLDRYLWDDPSDAEPFVARYLWDEAQREEDRLDRYLWDDPSDAEPVVARYLWDEAQREQDRLNRYRWDDPSHAEPVVARYLWDEAQREEGRLNRYLWDDPSDTEPVVARYLWDEIRVGEKALPRERNLENSPPKAVVAPSRLAMPEPYKNALGRFLWREYDQAPVSSGLDGMEPLQHLMGQEHHLLEFNQNLQIAQAMKVYDEALSGREVALTGSQQAIRGEASLQFSGQSLSWKVINQGTDRLNLSEISWQLPGTAKPTRLSIASTAGPRIETPIAERLRGSAAVAMQMLPGEAATLTFKLDQKPISTQDQYQITMEFESGQRLQFEPAKALPIQGEKRDSYFPTLIGADHLHRTGITGEGVGIAVIDTGAWGHEAIVNDTQGRSRVRAYFDVATHKETQVPSDNNGHGTHITSVLASSQASFDEQGRATGSYHGIAPDADLIIVKAFNDQSKSTYLDVVSAIAYVVQNRDRLNIKVMTLAFQGEAVSHYWQDPINQAVMAAWDAGIAVVVSGGNKGPNPMTIGAPGNVPYVITVGAMTDDYTLTDLTDDYIATFSAVGPTLEGFAKPELTAPGGHMMGLVPVNSTVTSEHPDFHDGYNYYLMSGTSQAAAAVSGVVALMYQNAPGLSPDDVKCRLMASARQASIAGEKAFSVLEQGAGLVDAVAAVESRAKGCANQGLDLKADLAGRQHFRGPFNTSEAVDRSIAEAAEVRANANAADRGFRDVKPNFSSALTIFNRVTAFNDDELRRTNKFMTPAALAQNGLHWQAQALVKQGYLLDRGFQNAERLVFDPRVGVDVQLLGSYLLNLKQSTLHDQAVQSSVSLPINVATQRVSVEGIGSIWNVSAPENAGFIWNLSAPENAGFVWNLSAPENAGFIWNLSAPENAGFIWNLSAPENAGFIWNLSAPENAGFIWNLSAPENAGFIWNLSAPENAGFIWNLSAPENAGFIWNLSAPENAGFIWNLSAPESAGFIQD